MIIMPLHLNIKQVLYYYGNTETNGTKKRSKNSCKIPLKSLINFWRSLVMPLINCKIELSLKWIENCGLTTAAIGANANADGADSATLKITDAKLYVTIVYQQKTMQNYQNY